MENLNYREIGKRIQNKRKELKITQEKLSEIIDVSPSYISEIERGSSICSLSTIVNIAKNLDVSLDYLVFGITEKNIDKVFVDILSSIPNPKKDLYISLCENIAQSLKQKQKFITLLFLNFALHQIL